MNKKEMAVSFLQMASSGKVREAYERYVHKNFRHHNAWFKGDRETLLKGMEENAAAFPDKTYEVVRILEEGDLVAVHGRITFPSASQWSVIHILRFADGLIAEEWEASQEVLKDSPNSNGLF
ncbi:MAG TPA: nuclear transport factor 2 family protein [Bacteroidota bacterium]|nr:nuclear transport factor 2 family protein [Bacteroidota bacterium]